MVLCLPGIVFVSHVVALEGHGRGQRDGEDDELFFCARVKFLSNFGDNVTAISNACTSDESTIETGTYIHILYNPAYPREFIEQETLQKEMVWQMIMVGVGLSVSLIMIAILCRLLKRQPSHRPGVLEQNEWDFSARPTESQEERKERILSKLYLLTVPEDSSKIAASSIRSMGRLDASTKTCDESEESANGDHGSGEEEKNENGKEEKLQNDFLELKQEDSTTVALEDKSQQGVSSTISSFWSNLVRPNHDAECCICLECYEPGEVICASKSEECNHVFHKECLMHWMMKGNDRCPLCRVDFLIDEKESE